MTITTSFLSLPSEYITLVQLANQYMVVCITGSENRLISYHPEVNPLIAYEIGKVYSLVHKIPIIFSYFTIDNPVVTVLKNGEGWFPAKIYSSNIEVIFFDENRNLIRQYSDVYKDAIVIAEHFNLTFLPKLGIDLQRNLDKISPLKV